jgi:hypothetical protein
MWLGYQDGELPIAPDEMDPRVPCDLVRAIPELVVWDEFGWTIYLIVGMKLLSRAHAYTVARSAPRVGGR